MDNFTHLRKKIQHRAEILEETICELEAAGTAEAAAVQKWRGYLGDIDMSGPDTLLKIAVVGSVKSGKSTLINALIGEDLLRRGAGIVTAFLTRMVSEQKPAGWVELKSWTEINDEINTDLRMLPVFAAGEETQERFDIRVAEDRERIAFWLEKMKSEWLQSKGSIDPNFMFLERCVQGYPLIAEEIGEQASRIVLDASSLPRHQLYVGDEARAVWVRDVELYYPVAWLGDHIELADCQGSDSPNPTHFELLQKYLLQSRFIIYVISSRTGLREADFKLLNLVKALRMFPQTLFVLNLDFDAHCDRDDLERSIERVATELAWMAPEPRLFAFSALFQLLRQLGDKSAKFERRRYKLWKESKALSKLTEAGFNAFKKELDERIRTRKSQVLLGFAMSRLEMVAANMLDSATIGQCALEKDAEGVKDIAEQLRARHIALQSTLENLADTVSGLNQNLKRDLGQRIDKCFDSTKGPIIMEALEAVEACQSGVEDRGGITDYAKLIRDYYAFYLEFRRNLIRCLTERVNLSVMELVKKEESLLRERIRESSRALWAFFDAALADYRRGILGGEDQGRESGAFACAELDFSGMVPPPPFSSFLERDSIARGIHFLKFGLSSFSGLLLGLKARLRGDKAPGLEEKSINDLFQRAVRHARNEAKSELIRAINEFREILKTSYLYKIIDEGSIFLLREFTARAEMAQVDFANLLSQSRLNGDQRVVAGQALTRARQMTAAMLEDLVDLRQALKAGAFALEEQPPEEPVAAEPIEPV